jgi:hypothetical protein
MILALLAVALLAQSLGCMAVSSRVRGVCHKSVVVYDNELYVVDLNRSVAHKVTITECAPAEHTEVVIVETEE